MGESMGSVRIVADSTSDLTQQLIEQYNVTVIPLNIVLDSKSYMDGVEITPKEIYEWSDKVQKTPKTASPELGYVMNILKASQQAKEEVIYIGISEDMSVTCQVIRTAAEELEYKDVYVINSQNLSTGIGLQVLMAAELAKEGKSAKEIVEAIENIRGKVRASFVVDTLTYLHRGGRCNMVTTLLGNTLKLKPMIVVKDGKMGVDKKYRGKLEAVIMNYVKDLHDDLLKADPQRVFITHSSIDKAIETKVYTYLKELDYFKEILITRAGGVISSHCGPNTLGVLFIDSGA